MLRDIVSYYIQEIKISKKRIFVMAKQQAAAKRTRKKKQNTNGRPRRPGKNRIGTFFLFLQALISIIFMGVVFMLDMLPVNYLAVAAMVLFFLW